MCSSCGEYVIRWHGVQAGAVTARMHAAFRVDNPAAFPDDDALYLVLMVLMMMRCMWYLLMRRATLDGLMRRQQEQQMFQSNIASLSTYTRTPLP
jgi:hypothetical protein